MSRSKSLAVLIAALLSLVSPSFAQSRAPSRASGRLMVVFAPGTSRAKKKQILKDLGVELVESLDALDVAIVRRPLKADSVQAITGRARRHKKVVGVEEDFYTNWLKLDEPAPSSEDSAFAGAEGLSAGFAGLRRILKAAPKLAGPSGEAPWGVARVGAPSVWRKDQPQTLGAGVRVAVIDTGVDCTHPDLQCDFSAGVNVLDPSAPPADDNGHGTHVSGTIAAKWDGRGVVGVAPDATIIPVKVLDKDGGGALSDVVRGINWAAEHHVDVINMSLGSPKGSRSLEAAINRAYRAGVTIVAAAGNEGPDPDTVGYPGAYPHVIAVAASDKQDDIADFSSRGPQVAFTAPGVDILSTVPGGGYEQMSGTSMASPHMAGLAALAIANGAHGPDAVRAALSSAAKRLCHVDVCPGEQLQGRGMVLAGPLLGGDGAVLASLGAGR